MTQQPELYSVDPSLVLVLPNRQRQEFDPDKLNQLKRGIASLGQLQPALCWHNAEGKPVLIAGERRLRACKELGIEYKYVVPVDHIPTEEDFLLLEQMEAEENLNRENLSWHEEIAVKHRLHHLLQKIHGPALQGRPGGHTIQNTADLLGETKSNTSMDLDLAEWVAKVPKLALEKTKSDARKLLKGLQEQVIVKSTIANLKSRQAEQKIILSEQIKQREGSSKLPLPSINDKLSPKNLQAQELHYTETETRCICGEFLSLVSSNPVLTVPFQIVLFDPPWGVDFDKVKLEKPGTKDYEDDKDSFLSSFQANIEAIYSLMAPDSHLYCFFGMPHFEFVYSTLESAGFTTNRLPILWYKRGMHRTRNPTTWPGRCYEPIAFARKGSKDLSVKGGPDIIETSIVPPSIKKFHPSAKHPQIYLELLKRSAYPGDRVLDPMCGSGMSGVAIEKLKTTHLLDYILIDQDKEFVELAIFNILSGYDKILSSTRTVDKSLESSESKFTDLIPGTPQWLEYWKANPDQQGEMLSFANEFNKKKEQGI